MADTNSVKLSQPLQHFAPALFALTVALLPIGLGGNRPLPLGLAQIFMAVSFFLYFIQPTAPLIFPKRVLAALGLLLLVVIWGLFQALPFAPPTWVHPLWSEAAQALNKPLAGSIALDPESTFFSIMRFVTYILAGIAAYLLLQDRKQARRFIRFIWITGLIICLYGLGMRLLGIEKILWLQKSHYLSDLTATFVNRNHFALYTDMVLLCGLALIVQSLRRAVHGVSSANRVKAFTHWLKRKGFIRLFALLFVLVCILYSHSRAGLALAIIGVFLFTFFYLVYLRRYKLAIFSALAALFVFISVALLANFYLQRFDQIFVDNSSVDRFNTYTLTLQSIKDNPLLGYGLGSFDPLYRLYQPGVRREFTSAHSDILEAISDLGIPAAMVLACAILLLLSVLLHGVTTRRHDGAYPVLGLSVALIALLHASVDFSLQIPALSILFSSLIGMGLGHSWSKRAETT